MHEQALVVVLLGALSAGARAEVPLRWDSTSHVVVPTFVNGKGPFDFILDTGADETGVYGWFAKSLQLPPGESKDLSGATGTEKTVTTRVAKLTVDGYSIENVDADTLPDRTDSAKLAGVTGADLMMGRLVVMDLGCGTAAVLPMQAVTPKIVGSGATLTKAGSIRDGKQLTLPVTINGVGGVGILDTGARATAINRKFAHAAGVDPESSAFHAEPTRGATMKAVTTRVGPIGTVRFAGITRAGVVARVVDLPFLKGAGLANQPAMNMGLDLLHGIRLTVDYSSRQFWIAQSSCPSQSAPTVH
jgi:predicted aspartyl protease